MIAHVVTSCAECPYAERHDHPWICTAGRWHQVILGTPARDPQPVPPEWCPLREADRLVTLRVS